MAEKTMTLTERYLRYCGVYCRVFTDYISMHDALSYEELDPERQGELSMIEATLRFFYSIPLGYEGTDR